MGGERIEQTFQALRARNRRGLIAFVTAGDPDFAHSADVICAVDRAGADLIEIGVPFSDPVADGEVIQRAGERARQAGATLSTSLDLVARIRSRVAAPLVLFTYANPVFRYGLDAFAGRAANAGVDGVLVVDVPIEECAELHDAARGAGLAPIPLVSPTTSDDRIARAAIAGQGFVYAISRLGVTGARADVDAGVARLVQRIRTRTSLPIAVGFGIARPEHVRAIVRHADAAVVGSGLVRTIEEAHAAPDLPERVEAYIKWLRAGLEGTGV